MHRSIPLSASTCLSLAVAACASPQRPLRLRRVVLYQNGIGYFEHSGHASQRRLRLKVRDHEVNDLLKTLTVVSAGGEELGATTVSTAIDRGGSGAADPKTSRRGDDRVSVQVHLAGRRAPEVTVAYAVPTPAWRPTYRIVLPEGRGQGSSLLQGWASVQNTSDSDWRDVSLTLATSAPLSFDIDLRTPEFVPRPDLAGQLIKPVATGAVDSSKGRPGDADSDGIGDADDACPTDPEDFDSFEDSDGCPDPDNDADGILDIEDACPTQAELNNGIRDDDGCPDLGRVVVMDSQVQILDRIYFASGSVQPMQGSHAVVDAIARVLIDDPRLASVEIQGHAADDEGEVWALSRRRADAVRSALVSAGVAAGRLEIGAFGATQPADRGASEAARARNRRVSFRVLDHTDSPEYQPGQAVVTARSMERAVSTAVSAREVAGAVQYRVASAVTVAHGESTLVPIVNRRVAGEEVFLFRPDDNVSESVKHPFRAARIRIGSDITLTPGPVAIFARGTFVGEGLLDALFPGESAFIPYALDRSTVVGMSRAERTEPDRLLSLADGTATIQDHQIITTTYEVRSGGSVPARVFINHDQAPGFEVFDLPPGSERSAAVYLVPAPVTPGSASLVAVNERRPTRRRVDLRDWAAGDLSSYLVRAELGDAERAALLSVVGVRTRLRELSSRYEALDQERRELSHRAEALREDIKALGTGSPAVHTRLARGLATASERHQRLTDQLAALSSERVALRIQLDDELTKIKGPALSP